MATTSTEGLGSEHIDQTTTESTRSRNLVVQRNSVVHDIQAIYNTGKPLFTKDAMRKLGEELGVLRKGLSAPRKITHTGINGEDVELSLDPASLLDGASFSALRWIIHYSSIEELTVKRDICSFNPQTAFLPMRITSCTIELEDNQDLNWEDRPPISTKGLHGLFQDVVRQWGMGQHHEEIRRVITAATVPFVLDKVVAFGCGPLTLTSQCSRTI
ncbi:uncharacterized protein BCR38DRAFT_429871 [Pseudomassariella vexata]|uniref:Uncharacterized protein n=1 Tax=Pseudomassariella vexata TaxID=1141098 RepID=A0A1Y2E617_9PEZI|nr:uncharacterized protein BCR38DRAFT_429871 [Pseudomassariella vexata]ORY66315.1 hypothetical protein BCR38DRAFT_429871 [Pseudomassariella vexata]